MGERERRERKHIFSLRELKEGRRRLGYVRQFFLKAQLGTTQSRKPIIHYISKLCAQPKVQSNKERWVRTGF